METFSPHEFHRPRKSSAEVRAVLDQFERFRILEVFFARLDNRLPDVIPAEYAELYAMDLEEIRNYLLNQHPRDPILHRFIERKSSF